MSTIPKRLDCCGGIPQANGEVWHSFPCRLMGLTAEQEHARVIGDKQLRTSIPVMRLRELERDAARLDKLDKMRRHYTHTPFRAVTGWEWSVVSESTYGGGVDNVREAIDDIPDPT
jgi:hypothetical protein